MNQHPSLIKILEMLKQAGETSENIAAVLQEIANAASAKLYFEMMSALTEEDMKIVDKCQNQEEAEPLLRSFYAQRTNSSPEILVNQFVDVLAKEFISKFKAESPSAIATPVEPAPAITPA